MSALGALLCSPVDYDLPAQENDLMNLGVKIDKSLAVREHTDFVNLLQYLGISIRLAPPREYLWGAVFTANWGFAHGERALLSNFKMPTRHP